MNYQITHFLLWQKRIPLACLVVSLVGCSVLADVPNHSGGVTSQRRTASQRKLCVCQYQGPSTCGENRTQSSCRRHHRDCEWVRGGPNPSQVSLEANNYLCRNRFQANCNREIRLNPHSCSETRIELYNPLEGAPGCVEPFDEYYYTYMGHGRGPTEFLSDVRGAIRASTTRATASHSAQPNRCRMEFFDQGCDTFNAPDIAERRSVIDRAIVPELSAGQEVTIRANQFTAYDDTNPYFAFYVNHQGIQRESRVSCSAAQTCARGDTDRFYFCETSTGIRRRTCCRLGPSQYGWIDNALSCPNP